MIVNIPSGDWEFVSVVHPSCTSAPEIISPIRLDKRLAQVVFETESAPLRELPGRFEPNQDDLRAVERLIGKLYPKKRAQWIAEIRRQSRQYPSDWWARAIKLVRHRELNGKQGCAEIRYIFGVMRNWLSVGSPERGAWDDYDDDMVLRKDTTWKPPESVVTPEDKQALIDEEDAILRMSVKPEWKSRAWRRQ